MYASLIGLNPRSLAQSSTDGMRSHVTGLSRYTRESEGMYVFTGVGLCVYLSVTTITKKIVDRFAPNFMRMFLAGKGRPSSCFVTIGRGMWK